MDSPALWHNIEARLDSSLPQWRGRIREMGQLDAVRDRGEGRTWSDDEVFEALLLAVLSANTDWSKIEALQAELADLFSGFSLAWYAERSDSEIRDRFLPWFKDRKAGSMTLARNLASLVGAAHRLLAYSRIHGTAEGYFTSLLKRCDGDPKQAALRLGCPGADKLPAFGVALAAEALKNLGFDVAKPDRHIMRAMGVFGRVRFSRWPPVSPSREELRATMATVQEMAEAVEERVVLVDNAIWLLCAKSGLGPTDDRELAAIGAESEPSEDRAAGLGALIRSWMDEDSAAEQRETMEHLVRGLDENRLSDRKLFPKELKGKSW